MLNPGMLLQGRYRVIRNIGGGGMAVVYLAEDTRLPGRHCAVKEMSPAQAQDRNWAISAFKQEAQILANLKHPGITPVTDFFAERGNWYLVMEFVEGQSLDKVLVAAPGQRLPASQALNILEQLCKVLEYLHARTPPVIFRDLKPGNVMLTPANEVKLIDFGIARFFKPIQGRDTVNLGTPGYAAPEQYGGIGQTDARADVYGLGVLLHQMLTGYDPTSTPFRLPPAESLNQNVSPQVGQAIRQATQQDMQQRFPSVRDFRAAVVGKTDVFPPTPVSSAAPRWLIGMFAAGALIMLLVACGVGAYFLLKPESTPAPTVVAQATGASTAVDTPIPPTPKEIVLIVTSTPGPGTTLSKDPVEVTVIVTTTPEPPIKTKTPTRTQTPSLTPIVAPSNQAVYSCGPVRDSDICIINLSSGRSQEIISHSADDTEPDWSPDKQQIVFQSNRTGNYDLWGADANGANPRNLTSTSGRDERGPDWSPDGSQILYEVGDGSNNGELWVMNANGSSQHQLLNRSISGRVPAWSPDGRQVAFMRQETNGYWQIYVLNLSTGSETKLSHANEHCRFPAWSPDGRYIAYNTFVFSASPKGQTYEVWRISASGSGSPQRLTTGSDNGRPSWSPDGQSIIYNHGEYLYLMSASGSNSQRLEDTWNGWSPDW